MQATSMTRTVSASADTLELTLPFEPRTQVTINSNGAQNMVVSATALRSLGGLVCLQQLTFEIDQIFPGQLQHLTNLPKLISLRLLLLRGTHLDSQVDARILLSLTQLTRLELHLDQHDRSNSAAAVPHFNAYLLPQLGCLSQLQNLALGWRTGVEDAAFDALCLLTTLTAWWWATFCC